MVPGHPKSRSPLVPSAPTTATAFGRPLLVGMSAAAAVTLIVALAALNTRASYGARTTADEPQYLLTALSLAEDRDLDIADELVDRRFLPFHELPLNPQTVELTATGQRLSPHDPLLPLLLAAPMRIGGWPLARTAMAIMAAITAAATTAVAVRRFDVGVRAATITTIGLFASPPLTAYGSQIYPEMPAALATMIGLAAVTGPASTRNRALAALTIVALPWLSIKYGPVALVLAVALLAPAVGDRTARRPAIATVGVLVAAAGLYLVVHQRVYGGWTVYAAGDHFVDGEFLVVGGDPNYLGRSRRLIGLLVDRGFGIVAWAPAYALAPAAMIAAARRSPRWRSPVAVVAAGWAVATWVALTMHGWWWPGRQLVVVLPVLAIAMAAMLDRRPGLQKPFIWLSTLAVANWLWLVIEASTGRRTLIVDFDETSSVLYRLWAPLLPDHRTPEATDAVLTVLWLLALAGISWLILRRGDRQRDGALSTERTVRSEPVTRP